MGHIEIRRRTSSFTWNNSSVTCYSKNWVSFFKKQTSGLVRYPYHMGSSQKYLKHGYKKTEKGTSFYGNVLINEAILFEDGIVKNWCTSVFYNKNILYSCFNVDMLQIEWKHVSPCFLESKSTINFSYPLFENR